MATKATLERLTQLQRAAVGKETKRPVSEILASEKSAARQFIPPAQPVTPPAVVGGPEASA